MIRIKNCLLGILLLLSLSYNVFQMIEIHYKKHAINMLRQRISNVSNVDSCKVFHFSFDDCINVFADITNKSTNYKSLFENPTLNYLQELNSLYGVKFSLYCYLDNEKFSLSDCTEIFRNEFEQNSSWLRFGFHSGKHNTEYEIQNHEVSVAEYKRGMELLENIVGKKSLDYIPRLHRFKGKEEFIDGIINCDNGILGLLSADDDRETYYFDSVKSAEIIKTEIYYDDSKGICIIPTDLRMEGIDDIDEELKKIQLKDDCGYLICFTHEWMIDGMNLIKVNTIKSKIEGCCEYAIRNNYLFAFPMDIIKRNL